MPLHHSEETHRKLLDHIPTCTGRKVGEWIQLVADGPCFPRFEERVNWLRSEHDLAHGHATAIAHEFDVRRAARAFG